MYYRVIKFWHSVCVLITKFYYRTFEGTVGYTPSGTFEGTVGYTPSETLACECGTVMRKDSA